MAKSVRCEGCGIEVDEEKCIFATEKKVIDGKEYTFCCAVCSESFEKDEHK